MEKLAEKVWAEMHEVYETEKKESAIMSKVIRFRRLSRKSEIVDQKVREHTIFHGVLEYTVPIKVWIWEIAFSEEHLFAKLNGEMAEIIMPARCWHVRLWRKFFPLRGIDML